MLFVFKRVIMRVFIFLSILFSTISACTMVKVTAEQLNIRTSPSVQGQIVGKLQKNDTVCAYNQNGNWMQIDQGWVSAKYLTKIQDDAIANSSTVSSNVQSLQPLQHVASNPNSNAIIGSGGSGTPVKSDMTGEVVTSLFVLVMAIYVVMLLVGIAGKVVVYYDEADLVISLLPWLISFVTVILAGIYQPTEQDLDPDRMLLIQKIVWYIGGSLAIGFAMWTIELSIKYNKSIFLGVIFGIFKLLSGLIGVLVLISQVFTMKDEKTKRKDFWFVKNLLMEKRYIERKDGTCPNDTTKKNVYTWIKEIVYIINKKGKLMAKTGIARYDESSNTLYVIRPGENRERKIKCTNLNPRSVKVFGVQVEGDEIWVLTGPKTNSRPNRKYIYFFSSLSGGRSKSL